MASALREIVRSYKRNRLEARVHEATGEGIKRANAELNWREFWHKRAELRSRPRQVQVGTNWTCNLRCNFCRLTLDSTQKIFKSLPPRELEISDKVFQHVIDLMPYPEMMTLTPLGEPMLYSKFGRLLERHREIGSNNLSMTTNANIITEERARMLVEGGMAHMFVSVDSSDPEIYAGMRVRGDLAKVEAALGAINRWKEKLHSRTPEMTLASTFMERNVRQMPDLLEFARRHGFRAYSIQLMETENQDLEGEFLGHHIPLAKEMLLETLRRAEGSGVEVRLTIALRNLLTASLTPSEWKKITAHTEGAAGEAVSDGDRLPGQYSTKGKTLIEKCHYPWYYLLIDTDGDCRPCCWAGSSYGNLNNRDFDDIWNGERIVKTRRDFLANHIPLGCQGKHCRVDLEHHGTMEKSNLHNV
ncbi:radical SAM protein [Candidatus Sumerlaeota bacterium]|nr:radical SAM protein [Candidatus Sumerlaeota bacterium]